MKDFIGERGYPQTLREIASNFGLKGPKSSTKNAEHPGTKGVYPEGPRGIESD